MTRDEWFKRCRENAYKQYDYDLSQSTFSKPDVAIVNACMTFISDMLKHPDTAINISFHSLDFCPTNEESMRNFIDSFE